MARTSLHDNQLEISGFLQHAMPSGSQSKKVSIKDESEKGKNHFLSTSYEPNTTLDDNNNKLFVKLNPNRQISEAKSH